jgi:hypothetical protein
MEHREGSGMELLGPSPRKRLKKEEILKFCKKVIILTKMDPFFAKIFINLKSDIPLLYSPSINKNNTEKK